jgi:hypothetical protein
MIYTIQAALEILRVARIEKLLPTERDYDEFLVWVSYNQLVTFVSCVALNHNSFMLNLIL